MSITIKNSIAVCVLSLVMMPSFADAVPPKTYGIKDTTINVARDQPVFIIKLVSNPTTGYAWSLSSYDKSILDLIKHQYVMPTTKLIGAPGFDQWTFKVKQQAFISPQHTTLKLTYARPWDKSDHATEVNFTVNT